MSRFPTVFALALGALGLLGSSCTFILAPRDDVQRCGTADDCDATMDARYVPVCRFDDPNLDSDQVEKICVADFTPDISCDIDGYMGEAHPYRLAFDELADSARYVVCTAEQQGMQGCPPMGGSCTGDLVVNPVGLCDDEDDSTPMAVVADTQELIGQDVRDQFCRSFFCDDRFVCNGNLCVPCTPGDDYGSGGCGEIYIGPARSCVYDDNNCVGANVTTDDVSFGCQ